MSQPFDARLLLEHAEFLRGLARSLVGDNALADDVVQETFAVALERPPAPGNLRGWLAAVARSVAFGQRRTAVRQQRRERAVARAEPVDSVAETTARLDLQKRLVHAVGDLEEPLRSTVVARFYDQLGFEEIAAREGVSVKTVSRRLDAALERLRGQLDAEHGGDRNAWTTLLLPLFGQKRKAAVGISGAGVFWAWHSGCAALALTGAVLVATVLVVVSSWRWEPAARSEFLVSAASPVAGGDDPDGGAGQVPLRTQDEERLAEAWIEGRVMDAPLIPEDGSEVGQPENPLPIADARVRACAPSREMATARMDPDARFVETRSDRYGRYALAIRVPPEGVKVSLDVLAPGHLSGWISFHSVSVRETVLKPGERKTTDFFLEPAHYVAGVVVDSVGTPIPGVVVDPENGGAAVSDKEGRFELFDIPTPGAWNREETVRIDFYCRGYRTCSIVDVDALSEHERANLRVVLEHGHRISGVLFDPRCAPACGVLVEAEYPDYRLRVADVTDAEGRFDLPGLTPGEMDLHAADVPRRLWLRQRMAISGDDIGMRLELQSLPDGEPPRVVDVLGVKLADVTPTLRHALAIHDAYHILVLDPGPEAERIGIGWVRAGDCVFDTKIVDVRGLLRSMLDAQDRRVGLCIGFRRAEFAGTLGATVRFEEPDIPKLREALQSLDR